mgnify:CR=1 FL=1
MSRRPIPPFITEFKKPTSRSSASRPPREGVAAAIKPKPAFLDPKKFLEDRSDNDDGLEAAMRAADALFSASVPAAHKIDTPAPPTTTGRILPSLIDPEDELTVRLREAETKRRRGRKPKADAPSSTAKSERPAPRPRIKPAAPSAAPSPAPIDAERQILSRNPRVRRPIQERWVFKTELKPGERWKRRLHRAAR